MKSLLKMLGRALGGLLILTLLSATAHAQHGRSWVNGIVFDESETHGVAGATVELIGDEASPRVKTVKLSTTTDEGGKYYFKDVPAGDYTFRASAPGSAPYQINLFIGADSLTALQVKLRKSK